MTQFSDPTTSLAADRAEPMEHGLVTDTLDDLPPADTKRWVVRRKEQVVQAVQAGRLSRDQACERYRLSDEEYSSWELHLSSHGVRGLRVTRLQDYRRYAPADSVPNGPVPRNPRMLARTS